MTGIGINLSVKDPGGLQLFDILGIDLIQRRVANLGCRFLRTSASYRELSDILPEAALRLLQTRSEWRSADRRESR